ncbi:SRA-YDG domain-containing protein [Corchorus olitorius]|uniref:SRA-YDG domain-containing protein n=1 Tax=Corchorus olitorius TaxID=93759 RepID=A0A1R3JBA5_9ROSI|nr:SRA-YDG domain-containing protein [Corchorus olitorius]
MVPTRNKGFLSNNRQENQVGKKFVYEPTEEWFEDRQKIKKALNLYRQLLPALEVEKNPDGRKKTGFALQIRAIKVLEQSGKLVNTSKQVGHVSGVKVGDEFNWKGELSIVGLHHDIQKGIDTMRMINGDILALSIVDSGRYDNLIGNAPGKLTYCGEGENPNVNGRKPKDQKLVGGNLALKNSMHYKMPVRVIRKIESFDNGYKFVYDGLYNVTKCLVERGKFGKFVYKFSLERIDGEQPDLDLNKRNKVEKYGKGKQKCTRTLY